MVGHIAWRLVAEGLAGPGVEAFGDGVQVLLGEGLEVASFPVGSARISASLATVELLAQAAGTRLVFTEQGAYFDGSDDGTERERGTRDLLDALARALGPT